MSLVDLLVLLLKLVQILCANLAPEDAASMLYVQVFLSLIISALAFQGVFTNLVVVIQIHVMALILAHSYNITLTLLELMFGLFARTK